MPRGTASRGLTSLLCEGLHGGLEVEVGAGEEVLLVLRVADKGHPPARSVDGENANSILQAAGGRRQAAGGRRQGGAGFIFTGNL